LHIAPLRRRAAAGSIDSAVLGLPILAVSIGVQALYHRWRGGEIEPFRFASSPHWQAAKRGASAAAAVATRNWRSPGYRILGLRRVEVRTGGPVSVRSSIVECAVSRTLAQLSLQLTQPWQARSRRRFQAIHADIEELRRAHPDDPTAQQRAMAELLKRGDVNPMASCLVPLLPGFAIKLTALWSPLKQSPGERVAGVVVIVEH
jgi:hypothetical protein